MTRDTHTCCQAFGSGAVTTCFLRFKSVAAGIWGPNLPHVRQTLQLAAPPWRSIVTGYKNLRYSEERQQEDETENKHARAFTIWKT